MIKAGLSQSLTKLENESSLAIAEYTPVTGSKSPNSVPSALNSLTSTLPRSQAPIQAIGAVSGLPQAPRKPPVVGFELLITPAFRPAASIMLDSAKLTALATRVFDFFGVIHSLLV